MYYRNSQNTNQVGLYAYEEKREGTKSGKKTPAVYQKKAGRKKIPENIKNNTLTKHKGTRQLGVSTRYVTSSSTKASGNRGPSTFILLSWLAYQVTSLQPQNHLQQSLSRLYQSSRAPLRQYCSD